MIYKYNFKNHKYKNNNSTYNNKKYNIKNLYKIIKKQFK